MNDKKRKKISNLFFVFAGICALITVLTIVFDVKGMWPVPFAIGIEIFIIIGLLLRLKDFIKWRGKLLAQGIQEAKAEMYCSKCGKASSKDSAFCSGCGSKIEN